MASKSASTTNSTGPWGPVFYACLAASLIGFGLFFDHASTATVPSRDVIEQLKNELAREQESLAYVLAEGALALERFNKPWPGPTTEMAQSAP
jgi:hypothetical protein